VFRGLKGALGVGLPGGGGRRQGKVVMVPLGGALDDNQSTVSEVRRSLETHKMAMIMAEAWFPPNEEVREDQMKGSTTPQHRINDGNLSVKVQYYRWIVRG